MVGKYEIKEPPNDLKIEEIAIDGGNIRVGKGEFKQYKAARLNGKFHIATFKDDEELINQINRYEPVKLLMTGDGHAGVWNVFEQVDCQHKLPILDWYHLIENLYKQPLEKEELKLIKTNLWKGKKEEVLSHFPPGNNYRNYLEKHFHRIVNYEYYQKEGLTIGSGAVESSIKQINARMNLAGARWKRSNVPKMLKLRCAFLNLQYTKSQSIINFT